MRTTKNWGFVNSKAELYMLAHAEHTRKELEYRESQKRKNSRHQTLRKQSTR